MRYAMTLLFSLLAVVVAVPDAGAQYQPVPTLLGQQIQACKAELKFRMVVAQAELRPVISGRRAPAGSAWAVVVLEVTNYGGRADSVQGLASVRDDRGRKSEWRLFNGADITVENNLAAELKLPPAWELVDGGATVRLAAVFVVAENVRALQLLPNNISCSN